MKIFGVHSASWRYLLKEMLNSLWGKVRGWFRLASVEKPQVVKKKQKKKKK